MRAAEIDPEGCDLPVLASPGVPSQERSWNIPGCAGQIRARRIFALISEILLCLCRCCRNNGIGFHPFHASIDLEVHRKQF